MGQELCFEPRGFGNIFLSINVALSFKEKVLPTNKQNKRKTKMIEDLDLTIRNSGQTAR